ncbi:SAG-related sequence [Besnoitia besnoiti]|uniref:SAG-related sequence n=1 Tax=Besnoitia besnoiti TaxID=94643 RepID=A0A2A9MFY8_BESBE|nr:SAG-related sequence [Besnoitia besnoiti]PFH36839.1 SAG-related sequence [Besnoitia besnoiti]
MAPPNVWPCRKPRKRLVCLLSRRAAVIFLVGLIALCGRQDLAPCGATQVSPVGQKAICDETGGATTCTCEGVTPPPSEHGTATLSEKATTLHILCKKGLTCAPDKLGSTKVCDGTASAVQNCASRDEGGGKCVDLSDIFVGASTLAWASGNESDGSTPKSLVVTKANLPFVDKKFVVGCVKGENAACTVAVAVNARPTEKTGQTVTCAYGENSNLTPQTVALNPSNRSFTLVCGEDGEVVPANYQASFCPVGAEKRDDQSGACTESYSQILPAYETSWWRNDGGKSSYTLTIPADKFPETEAKLNIRCQKKGASSSNRSEVPATPNPSVCSVDVTIEGVGKDVSSSASAFGCLSRLVALAAVSCAAFLCRI